MLAVASCLTLSAFSLSAAAAGLGKIVVFSGLGQPLRAEIEVTGTHEELLEMRAQMASKDTFRQAGVNYAGALENLHFVVGKRGDGKAVIKVSSSAPINDPFVDMLLELNWANGRLVREYTFLLDPPEAAAKNAAPAVSNRPLLATTQAHGKSSRVRVEAPAPKAEEKSSEKAGDKAEAKGAAKPATETSSDQPQGKYEVKRGDTLSKIAGAHKPEGASLEQMLVALFRANQEAFDGGNMNRLQRGRILAIPESTAVDSVTPEEAEKIVKAQSSDWNAYRSRLATLAAKTPVKEGEGKQQASGKITARVEDKAAAPAEARDQVRLSRKDSGDAAQGVAGKPSEEDRVARDKALKEANERLALLEKNVANLQKLLELKSQSLAELQQRVTEKAAPQPKAQADEAKPTPPAASATPATPAAETAKAEPAPTAPTAAAPTATDAKPEEKPAAPAEAAAPAAEAPAAEAEAKPAPQPEPQPEQTNWVDLLRDNPLAQAGAGLLALLGVFALFRRRRNAQAVTAAESAESVESGDSADTEDSAAVAAAVSADSVSSEASVEAVASPEAERTDAETPEVGAAEAENPLYGAGEPVPAEAPVASEPADESRPVTSAGEALSAAASAATVEAAAADRLPDEPVPAPAVKAAPAAEPAPAPASSTADPTSLESLDFDLGPEEIKAKVPAPLETAGEPPASEPSAVPADPAGSNVLDFDLGSAADFEATPPAPMNGAAGNEAADALASGETAPPPVAVPASETEVPRPDDKAEPVPAPASFQPAVSPWPDLDLSKASKDDLGASFDLPRSTENVLGTPAPAGAEAFDMASINLDLGSPAPAAQTPAETPVGDATGSPGGTGPVDSFDSFGSSDPLAQPKPDETPDLAADFEISANEEAATKLDLAKAYEEMGDLEGARELLREVLTEGDAGQRAAAQALLDKIDA